MKSMKRALALCFVVFCSVIATAATTEYRVLIDTDNSTATGCPINTPAVTVPGIDQVLITTVDSSTNTVSKVERQQCTGGILGPRVTVDAGGWSDGASSDGSSFKVETYIPVSAFGTSLPSSMHFFFVAGSGTTATAVTSNANGTPVMWPPVVGRRHAAEPPGGNGATRTIVLDGDDHDWSGIGQLVNGSASFGNSTIKFTDISAFATSSRLFFLFRSHNDTSTNGAPTANNDTYGVRQGHSLSVGAPGVLANDTDPAAHTLTAAVVAPPGNGSLNLAPDGGFTYNNNANYQPTDTFQYKANNGSADSAPATVTINVSPDNAPKAFNDGPYNVAHAGTLNVAAPGVLGNDFDADADVMTAVVATQPAHGTLALNANGSFKYIHDGTNTLSDSFTYKATDGIIPSTPATVSITVGPDVAPVAAADTYGVLEGAALNVTAPGVLTNDTDVDTPQASLSAVLVSGPSHASTFTLGANGSFNYTNDNVTAAADSFTYKVSDGILTSNTVTVTINVTPVNHAPFFTAGAATVVVLDTAGAQSTPWATGINAGAADEGTQTLNFIVSNDNNALFTVQPSISPSGTLTFTPVATAEGIANVTVKLHDNGGTANGGVDTSAQVTFAINVDKIPTITSGNATTFTAGANGSFTVTTDGQPKPSINESGALPAGVAFVDGTGPNKGTGVLSGTPAALTGGVYPITFTATNTHGSSAPQNFTLTVNEAPGITSANTTTFQTGQAGTFTITTSGYPMPAISKTGALPGGVTLVDNGNGTATLSGTPAGGTGGSYPITVTASNGIGSNANQSFTLVVNQPPVITSGASTNFQAGTPTTFAVTTTGFPAPAITETGALPSGITLTDNGNGTATLGSNATQGSGGVYNITIKATNAVTFAQQAFTITVCNIISVTNPSTTSAPAGAAFTQNFSQTGAVGTATFTTASALPAGLSLSTAGVLSGTPTQTGTFPIVVTVADSNGCTGTGATYNLAITCPTITVTNPATTTGTAGTAFTQTFTQGGGVGSVTFTTTSTLPTGLTLSTGGVLSGTPTQTGTFPIVVKATDSNSCTGTGATYNLVINCQTINVTNPGVTTGTAASPFSQIFTQSNAIGTATFTTLSTLPAGLSLSTSGVLSGTPTQTGTFPIIVKVTDSNGCTGTGATYTLVISCQTITVTNPATTTGTVNSAFSQSFTQGGAIGTAMFTTASSLPNGLSLSTAGVLSGTPTQKGTFPIVVTVTDSNGCTGTGATYTLVINCQTIPVTNPSNTTGTVSAPFSEQFTSSNTVGPVTYSTASTLPNGLSLSLSGLLSGTPTQSGTFPIVVTATDANGCTGTGATYTLIINCQVISVGNPTSNSDPAGTPLVAANFTFTQSGAVGGATFTTASTLPTGVTLTTAGVLTGTPTQGGSFPITVTVTDGNGCTGSSSGYTLTITCPTITVTNPGVSSGTSGVAFSQQFTQSGGQGTITWSEVGTLPTGFSLNTSTGVLSGTTTQAGSFPITVTATDSNGCQGSGAAYNLVINCQTITVTNPVTNTGTVDAAFTATFTQSGILGTATWSETGALPAGVTLNSATGVLSGTPTVNGTFPITVKVTDTNSCFGTSSYTLTINCQTITVTNPVTNSGTVDAAFTATFTQGGAHGTATFTTASTLPTGLTLSAAGVLSGTPTVKGTFPIVVTVTDVNGCTGTGATYTLTINCQTITVTKPVVNSGTVNAAFSQQFTQSGAHATATFTTASTLPSGFSLDPSIGILSGTTLQHGTFPIVVTVTDANGCTGTSSTYTLVINCQTITVTNPVNTSGTVNTAFSEQFNQTGAISGATFTTASALPTGLTLSSSGLLSGTPTQSGTFPIVVTVNDGNGCSGTGPTYTLVIACNVITVTNPGVNTGTAGVLFNQQFTQSGGNGTITWSETGALPSGISLNTSTGFLTGTTTQTGSFPITVTATDSNSCQGTGATYTLTINCQTITITNATSTSVQAGASLTPASNWTFSATGILGTATWSETGALPTGITLDSSTGVLSGSSTQVGSFPITVKVTDTNGCFGTSSYTLTVTCTTITVTNPVTNTGTVDAAFTATFTQSGILGTPTWSETGALPAGITLNSATGVLSGTPTVNGSFPITVKVTDTNGCFGTSSYTLTINCQTITVTNPLTNSGTVDAAFTATFTQGGAHGTATFTTASTLPAGLTLSTAGVLSGTPTVKGTFPIVVTVTDANGCTGTGATYTLTINCQTITVTKPVVNSGTVNAAFSQQFTQSGAHATATFTTASTLPSGFSLDPTGILSGTTLQHGTFPIVVTVTDANGCTGTSATYTLVINCQTITVTNPVNTSGTVNAPFSEQFNQTGAISGSTFTTASTLPNGLSLSTSGVLSGTPTQSGTFPIVVTVADGNGCSGTGSTYTLVIGCNVITVTNPGVSTGTAGVLFNQQFTQSGGTGTVTWSETGALPSGITLNTSTGFLTGTTTQTGSFPITVTATDSNGCQGTGATYTLTINCQTITITNATSTSVQAGSSLTPASNWTFSASGILGTATWSETGALPTGVTFNSSTGVLSGSSTQIGSFPITVKVTDTNSCFGTSSYTLTVTCPTITVTRNGGGSFPAGTFNSAYAGQSVTASGGGGSYTFSITAGALPTGLSMSGAGAISGTPTATGTFSFTVKATDTSSTCTGSQAFSIQIKPVAGGDSYSSLVNNTQAVVTGGTTTSPATPFVALTGSVLANDLPSGGVAAVAGTVSSTNGTNNVVIAADGTFIYTPPVTAAALTTDTFTYTISSDTGATGTPVTANGTVTLNLAGRVWYVKNNVTNGIGQSQSPFNSLSNFTNAARVSPDASNDIIYVYNGDGTTTNQNAGVKLLANEQLIGQGVALVVNTNTLVTAGTKPQITNATATSDAVTLNDGNTVMGVTITGATRDGIAGSTHAGFTGDTLTIQNNTSSGLHLTSMTGTVTVTNTTFGGNGTGLDVNNGTAAITLDNTNTITSGATGRTVSIQNRPVSAGTIAIGAAINDAGTGILVNNNASGTINFTGTQTPNVGGANTAVSLTTNTGTTINFSGTLNATSATGSAFNATSGGTLNITGTANATAGAAGTGVNINAVTVGASGVTFNSINTTGATTGVSLTSLGNGNVTINAGTISGGTTGLSLNTLGTSTVTLAGVTLTGSTTAISGSTFGTLTIGSTVNVSGATALNLSTGAVSGVFNNVSSTGGTNGVSLNAVTGTWGTSAGSLTGATGATFKVVGGSGGTISWPATINQANGGDAVNISGINSNTINFSGNVTTSTTSTGINISGSSGTYNFTGATSTLAGSGGAITIANESGTISFGSGYAITNASPAFKIGGSATNTSANITYSGNMTPVGSGGTLLDINSASGTYSGGTITFNGTTLGGSVGNPTGVKSVINSMTGTLVANNLNLTSNNNGFTSTLLAIGGTNTGGSFTFNHLVLSATGTGPAPGFTMSGGGTLTITATGGPSSITSSGVALSLTGVALGTSTLATVTSTGGTNGILLSNVSGGTLTITGGALSGSSGSEVLVNGANAPTVSFGGTIQSTNQFLVDIGPTTGITNGALTFSGTLGGASTSAGLGLRVQNSSGGTVTFSGTQNLGTAVSNMASQAVTLASNAGSTINFSGTLSIFTNGAAGGFSTTAGTVNITGASNTINTVNGTAVNWSNAASTSTNTISTINATGSGSGLVTSNTAGSNFTIGTLITSTGQAVSVTTGTGAFVFTKISAGTAASGPTTGIHVQGLTGSFTINGTGGLCDATHISGTDCTGGTIQKASARGAEFISSNNVTLNNMYFKSNSSTVAASCTADVSTGADTNCNGPIFLQTIGGGATLSKIFIDGSSQMGIVANGVATFNMQNSEVTNVGSVLAAQQTALVLQNLSGTNTISGNHIHDNDFGHNVFITINTGTATVNFTNNTVDNVTITNPNASDGYQIQTFSSANVTALVGPGAGTCSFNKLKGNGVTMGASGSSTLVGTLTNCTVNLTAGTVFSNGNTSTMTANVTNNTITNKENTDWVNAGNGSNGISIGKASAASAATFTGVINGNHVLKAHCGGGCIGIDLDAFGQGTTTLTVTNNDIHHTDANGLRFTAGQATTNSNSIVTIQANTITDPDTNNNYAVDLEIGPNGTDAVCTAMNVGDMSVGNTTPGNKNTVTNGAGGHNWLQYLSAGAGHQGTGCAVSGIIYTAPASKFRLFNYGGSTDTQAQAWFVAANPGTSSDSIGPYNGGTTCP